MVTLVAVRSRVVSLPVLGPVKRTRTTRTGPLSWYHVTILVSAIDRGGVGSCVCLEERRREDSVARAAMSRLPGLLCVFVDVQVRLSARVYLPVGARALRRV